VANKHNCLLLQVIRLRLGCVSVITSWLDPEIMGLTIGGNSVKIGPAGVVGCQPDRCWGAMYFGVTGVGIAFKRPDYGHGQVELGVIGG
jgi:hypothetical protein